MIDFTLPSTQSLGQPGVPEIPNQVLGQTYKPYPTAKNIPASLKNSNQKKVNTKDIPGGGPIQGYAGEVLAADPTVREGKGLQQYIDGQVQEGYF